MAKGFQVINYPLLMTTFNRLWCFISLGCFFAWFGFCPFLNRDKSLRKGDEL